jgi:hypothetical protein
MVTPCCATACDALYEANEDWDDRDPSAIDDRSPQRMRARRKHGSHSITAGVLDALKSGVNKEMSAPKLLVKRREDVARRRDSIMAWSSGTAWLLDRLDRGLCVHPSPLDRCVTSTSFVAS